jgi:hypothetical protein
MRGLRRTVLTQMQDAGSPQLVIQVHAADRLWVAGRSGHGTANVVPPRKAITADQLVEKMSDRAGGRQIKLELAPPVRLERTAYGLGNRRSIQLSYGSARQE